MRYVKIIHFVMTYNKLLCILNKSPDFFEFLIQYKSHEEGKESGAY